MQIQPILPNRAIKQEDSKKENREALQDCRRIGKDLKIRRLERGSPASLMQGFIRQATGSKRVSFVVDSTGFRLGPQQSMTKWLIPLAAGLYQLSIR